MDLPNTSNFIGLHPTKTFLYPHISYFLYNGQISHRMVKNKVTFKYSHKIYKSINGKK